MREVSLTINLLGRETPCKKHTLVLSLTVTALLSVYHWGLSTVCLEDFHLLVYCQVTNFRPVPIFMLLTWNWFVRTNFCTFEDLKTKRTLKIDGFKAERNFHTVLIKLLFQKYESTNISTVRNCVTLSYCASRLNYATIFLGYPRKQQPTELVTKQTWWVRLASLLCTHRDEIKKKKKRKHRLICSPQCKPARDSIATWGRVKAGGRCQPPLLRFGWSWPAFLDRFKAGPLDLSLGHFSLFCTIV